MAPPWLEACADAWVGSGVGCQGAMDDPAPGQIRRRTPTLLNLHGQGGGQGGKAAQLRHCSEELPRTTSLYRVYNLFCCPECKDDFGSKSVLDKHKNKYDVYDNILEDLAYTPFKLSDRIGQNLEDLDGEENSEHEYDPKKEFPSEEEINQLCHNTETEKLLIEEICLECSM